MSCVTGIVKSIYKNVCVYVSFGVKVQKGTPEMMRRAYEKNKSRESMAKQKAEQTARKVYESLKSLNKQQKISQKIMHYFDTLPKDYEYYPPGTSGYSKFDFPEKVFESNAEEYLGKQCIYSFKHNDAEILISFKTLPEKNIRELIRKKVVEDSD